MTADHSAAEQRGWYVYDFAQTAFSTTVVTTFLGPYLTVLAKSAADARGMVHPFGIAIYAPSYWSYLVSLSVILQVVVLPVISAVADFGRRKKEMLAAAAYLGAAATMAMFLLRGSRYLLGGILFVGANVSFGAGVAIYNSFLPEIAPREERDAVSSKGWATGYMGGGLLLALNLLLYLNRTRIGLSESMAVRISLASAGAWWALFTIPPLLALHNRGTERRVSRRAVTGLLRQTYQTLAGVRRYPQTLKFIVAFLLYNDAIQTVIVLATQFGHDELKIPISQLTLAILMVQFVAIFGALAFQWLAAVATAKRGVIVSLVIWTGVLVYIYLAVKTTLQFFIMAAIVALVLGGSQALSRSLYAQLIPKLKEAQYYSIYEITDKGTSWLCPMFFGLALQFTRSYRVAILSLVLFFAAGLVALLRVDVEQGERDVALDNLQSA
ncbi:MAG TPA: MFS transporter [Bryobacteraceae bacterium]|nr:MFS transporter [Bryobacteraceae bacterium]